MPHAGLLFTAFVSILIPAAALAARPQPRPRAAVRRTPSPSQHSAAKQAAQRKAALINAALRQRGTRYVWGGASRGGFDCSGFTQWVFKVKRGIALPHSASGQARMGRPVPAKQMKPGDLLFFSTYRRGISHVGIYIGGGKFVHAANRRKGVRVDPLTGYYARRLKTARRV